MSGSDGGVYRFVQMSLQVQTNMVQDYNAYHLPGWMHIAHTSGTQRSYPGTPAPYSICVDHDATRDEFYRAAAMGPKDVVVLLDVSSNMCAAQVSSQRMIRARQLVHTILDTLTSLDFVNVVIFNAYSTVLGSSPGLMAATNDTILSLHSAVDGVSCTGRASFVKGLNSAFSVFSYNISASSGCQRVVHWISAGSTTDATADCDAAHESGQLALGHNPATFFTYRVSDTATDAYLQQVACLYGGMWQRLPNSYVDTSVFTSAYLMFFARMGAPKRLQKLLLVVGASRRGRGGGLLVEYGCKPPVFAVRRTVFSRGRLGDVSSRVHPRVIQLDCCHLLL